MADRDRPTSVERDEAEGFLRRWSRRKAEARSTAADQSAEASDPEGATAPLPQAPEPEAAPSPIDPEDLPDIESLDASSDFTVFMRPGVPEHLRTLALRKLWRSDPIFSELDGLVEYGEDYTLASWPKGVIKTAYQIGRGFADQLEKLEAAAPPLAPEGTPAAAAPEPGTAALPADDPADAPSTSESSAPEAAQPASPAASIPAAANIPVGESIPAASGPAKAAPAKAGIPAERRPRPLPRRG